MRSPLSLEARAAWARAVRTPLGWLAVAGSGRCLERLAFGHASPAEALRALGAAGTADPPGPRDAAWVARLVERLERFTAGRDVDFADVDIPQPDTPFARRVVAACRAIPFGQTRSYAEVARAAGSPAAARAVGNVMRTNAIPLVVPCHRVVGSGGALGGYSAPGGLATKRRLLELEQSGRKPGPSPRRPARTLAAVS